MPHFNHTPETLLGRNDSKNPATTCRGITSSGRPCRRALASPKASPTSRRGSSASPFHGVVAVVKEDGRLQEADFFCWQHKEQAEKFVEQRKHGNGKGWQGRRPGREAGLYPLQERSSIDTLVQRLGIDQSPKKRRWKEQTRPVEELHATVTTTQAPRRSSLTRKTSTETKIYPMLPSSRPKPKTEKAGFWASLCCMHQQGIEDDDYMEVVRHRRRTEQSRPPEMTHPNSQGFISHEATQPVSRPSALSAASSSSLPGRRPGASLAARPEPQQRSLSNPHTAQLLSLIPQSLSPATTSALMAELIKPISPHDEEGYIYIFWLTPQSRTSPPEDVTRSLLAPATRPHHGRTISDVMTEFSYDGSSDQIDSSRGHKRTIMLKIGRANNVTRRMNEWQRQCGYALNLVRWYPYVSSWPVPLPARKPNRQVPQPSLYPDLSRTPLASERHDSGVVRKVPFVKRVERLVQLELAEKQVKRQCTACGKEHREWFEVEADRAGVKAVDECIRRWVGWAERHAGV